MPLYGTFCPILDRPFDLCVVMSKAQLSNSSQIATLWNFFSNFGPAICGVIVAPLASLAPLLIIFFFVAEEDTKLLKKIEVDQVNLAQFVEGFQTQKAQEFYKNSLEIIKIDFTHRPEDNGQILQDLLLNKKSYLAEILKSIVSIFMYQAQKMTRKMPELIHEDDWIDISEAPQFF